MVAKSTAGFSADLQAFSRQMGVGLGTARKKVAFDIFKSVVKRSPTDTGRFRGSWTMADGSPSEAVQPEGQGSYSAPDAASQGVSFAQPFGRTWIANALPYATALEFGHSKASPNGMARIAVAEAEADLQSLLK